MEAGGLVFTAAPAAQRPLAQHSTTAPAAAAVATTPAAAAAAASNLSSHMSAGFLAAAAAAASFRQSASARKSRRAPKGRRCRVVAGAGHERKKGDWPWQKYGNWEVHKFGGASLETAELYKTCGDLLIAEMKRESPVIPTSAIVSAAGGMTDALAGVVASALTCLEEAESKINEAAARQIGIVNELLDGKEDLAKPVIENIEKDKVGVMAMLQAASLMRSVPPQMLELVAGLGEVWSAQTLAAYIKSQGVTTAWMDARDVLIVSDASSNKGLGEKGASLETIDVFFDDTDEKLNAWWSTTFEGEMKDPPLVIVTGFVCSTQSGRPTTLKRSGSDYSATIFAKVFGSSKVTMWKNVNGVYSADPRMVSDASSIASLTFDEAMELAYFGGQVLHPSAMIPCMTERIPVFVRNVFNPPHPGTRVYGRGDDWLKWDDQDDEISALSSELPVKALTSIEKVTLVTLTGASFLGTPGVASRMMDSLSKAGVNVILASQGSSEHSITVAVDDKDCDIAVEAVSEAFDSEISENYETRVSSRKNCSIVAVIGEGMKNTPGVSGKFFNGLAGAKVNIIAIAQGSSERNVSVVVDRDNLKEALQAAHDSFGLGA
mmetsp:Transcript_66872/g.160083  ORF Transcript_66872/g.160083 Transcript_66872/m.160083 type:complete len:605 (+) Transcript_66872:93-1907(+)|eukprot:CAMPEP_0178404454 /NCGR_PEP_ID=MMETSP0689_2-20121128/17894_1 /TAXON_ID=160604 /ORGANISM="Amphidinium massartii, Strain CS-259" /LENGTH=604 /DNA_ID=CAMNT_0020025443 /DNA_START=81 /DNA_END=1895 /DNA_ORIENTATION=+